MLIRFGLLRRQRDERCENGEMCENGGHFFYVCSARGQVLSFPALNIERLPRRPHFQLLQQYSIRIQNYSQYTSNSNTFIVIL
jgi:hypothetical protein